MRGQQESRARSQAAPVIGDGPGKTARNEPVAAQRRRSPGGLQVRLLPCRAGRDDRFRCVQPDHAEQGYSEQEVRRVPTRGPQTSVER